MDERILKLKPKRIGYCPICGGNHKWDPPYYKCNGWFVSIKPLIGERIINIRISQGCGKINDVEEFVSLTDIIYDAQDSMIGILVHFEACSNDIRTECLNCEHYFNCDLADKLQMSSRTLCFCIEFDSEEFNECVRAEREARKKLVAKPRKNLLEKPKENLNKEPKNDLTEEPKEQENQQPKEGKLMEEKATMSILEQLYTKPPKENVEIAKNYLEKYKPALKWAFPVAAVYAAHWIMKHDASMSAKKINKTCKSKLGIELEELKNKDSLKDLLAFGSVATVAYGVFETAKNIFNNKEQTKISVDNIEESLEQIDKQRKKNGWLQKTAEPMVPVALAVIVVYIATRENSEIKEMFESLTAKVRVSANLVKYMIADKLNVDVDDKDEMKKMKKFALIGVIIGATAFVYGKKVLGERANLTEAEEKEKENKNVKKFTKQMLDIMEKMMPTAFTVLTTWLVAVKVLKVNENSEIEELDDDDDDVIDVDVEEVEVEEETDIAEAEEEPEEDDEE